MYNDSFNEHFQDLLLRLLDRCSCYSSIRIRLNRKNDKMLPLPTLFAMNSSLSHSNYIRFVNNLHMKHRIQQ